MALAHLVWPDDRGATPQWRAADHAALRAALGVLFQLLLIVCAALLYFGVRGLTQGSESAAVAHARDLLHLERALGIDVEASLQRDVLEHRWMINIVNWVYMWGHWPVIAVTLFMLYARRRRTYVVLRNAMFISGAIGLVIFATYPVAPPRLLPPGSGFIDTVTQWSTSYRVLQPPSLVNKYAAMPSLHAGWNLLVGIALWHAFTSKRVRAFAVASPLLMAFAVVATANHYVIDAIAGAALSLVGLVASIVLLQWADRRGIDLTALELPAWGRRSRSGDGRGDLEAVDDHHVDADRVQSEGLFH
ncbi:MAG: phosphatase PAP2 family protein [Acidimicrobiia bacterium]